MKKITVVLSLAFVFCFLFNCASACTSIYVGNALTADGTVIFGRSEDFGNSYNKLMMVIPAGVHKAGETYDGCYGFSYTFTKDSYGYTAFCDDNGAAVDNVCPDCGDTHPHTPYQAGGTNEMGVSMSATETLGYDSETVLGVDPFEDLGIEEAEITTIVLSQAATAKEGIELLTGIYDAAGCNSGSGIFIADNTETWYIENVTGHQYIAVKLSDSMVFSQPNMSIIGLVDLDDKDNVIASADLIAVAQKAGTFVGDADANVIDYIASYSGTQTASTRMIDSLNYFNGEAVYSADNLPVETDYAMSNVDAEGNIVPFYTNIKLPKAYAIEDVQNFYHTNGSIGKPGNLETHVFQISAEDSLTDTVEWVAMDDAAYSAFVPYYPMLTTEVDASYQLSTATATFVEEEPAEGMYYPTTARKFVDGQRVSVEGFKVYPENWADSYYWTIDVLSNKMHYCGADEATVAAAQAAMMAVQAEINAAFETTKANVAAAESTEAAAAIATADSMAMAQKVHATALNIIG